MKRLGILFALLGVVGAANATMLSHGSVGPGRGIAVPRPGAYPCDATSLCLNYDGSAENGYCWQYGGVAPPYYGAFAECYNSNACSSATCVQGVALFLTGAGHPCGPCTVYVWADAGGVPGNVLATTSFNPCPVATWPNVSESDCCLNPAPPVTGNFWAGYWADFSTQPCGYYVAADLNGFGGCPYTNIAPGIGYPTGWQNVSVVWGATQSIGIGVWVGGLCIGPIPTRETTWGEVKKIYN